MCYLCQGIYGFLIIKKQKNIIAGGEVRSKYVKKFIWTNFFVRKIVSNFHF